MDNTKVNKYLQMCKRKRGRNEKFLDQVVEDIKKGKMDEKSKVASPRSNPKKSPKS